jgi:putative transposase
MNKWAYGNQVTMDYSGPGKPTGNPFVESFNDGFRDGCRNARWFLSLEDTAEKIERWRTGYNHCRPHGSMDDKIPAEYAEKCFELMEESVSPPDASVPDQMIFCS